MSRSFTDFWSKLEVDADGLYIHPDDLRWFQANGWSVQDQSPTSFKSFIRGERFRAKDDQLHLSLLPVPFVGNLQKATIFILLLNPGLTPSDYYADEDAEFRAASIRNLRQLNGDDEFPFFTLNPEFAWSGGFIWWEARLRPIVEELLQSGRFPTYYSALAFLAKRIAVIELVPYHSVDGRALAGPGNVWKGLPSATQAIDFVRHLCKRKDSPLILVLRSHKSWQIGSHTDCKCKESPAIRRPTLNPKLEGENGAAGRAILKKLGLC